MKKLKGFTLAEILITLSIIGIVAAISIPSLLVNINDKTYDAQRNALLARMSQAVGQMDDINSYEKSTAGAAAGDPSVDQSSAVAFISKGLSKVYKISSVCGVGHLDSCDFSEKIKLANGADYDLSSKTKIGDINPSITSTMSGFNPNVAGFMTTNGESILVYYNPRCTDKHENDTSSVLSEVCVNMIYDLNGGGKAPNTFGKDIGFMTIMFPSTPTVVAPVPYSENIAEKTSYGAAGEDAASACSNLNGDLILPDRESMVAMVMNKNLIGNLAGASAETDFWTATVTKPGETGSAWSVKTDGSAALSVRSGKKAVRCIKK